MIDEEREYADVLAQVAAIRAALDSLGSVIISRQVEEFMALTDSRGIAAPEEQSVKAEKLRRALLTFLR